MSLTTLLPVDRLDLRNFLCFAECTIELHPQLTVLVAENARGKTAILDAIGIALGPFVDTVTNARRSHGFYRTDVRLVPSGAMDSRLPTEFLEDGHVAGQALRSLYWSCDQKDSCGHYKDCCAGAYNVNDLIDPCVDNPDAFFRFRTEGTINVRSGLGERTNTKEKRHCVSLISIRNGAVCEICGRLL
jgi:hypothetical protein